MVLDVAVDGGVVGFGVSVRNATLEFMPRIPLYVAHTITDLALS